MFKYLKHNLYIYIHNSDEINSVGTTNLKKNLTEKKQNMVYNDYIMMINGCLFGSRKRW